MGRSLITTPLIVDEDLTGTMRSGRFRFPMMRKIVIAIADSLLREGAFYFDGGDGGQLDSPSELQSGSTSRQQSENFSSGDHDFLPNSFC